MLPQSSYIEASGSDRLLVGLPLDGFEDEDGQSLDGLLLPAVITKSNIGSSTMRPYNLSLMGSSSSASQDQYTVVYSSLGVKIEPRTITDTVAAQIVEKYTAYSVVFGVQVYTISWYEVHYEDFPEALSQRVKTQFNAADFLAAGLAKEPENPSEINNMELGDFACGYFNGVPLKFTKVELDDSQEYLNVEILCNENGTVPTFRATEIGEGWTSELTFVQNISEEQASTIVTTVFGDLEDGFDTPPINTIQLSEVVTSPTFGFSEI